MDNAIEYHVTLKKGSRIVRQVVCAYQDEAERITQAWYKEADGNRFEIVERPVVPVEQVSPKIPKDQYLTQQQIDYARVSRFP